MSGAVGERPHPRAWGEIDSMPSQHPAQRCLRRRTPDADGVDNDSRALSDCLEANASREQRVRIHERQGQLIIDEDLQGRTFTQDGDIVPGFMHRQEGSGYLLRSRSSRSRARWMSLASRSSGAFSRS